ncbi:MAG: hypothetical protein KF758_04730 [Anaerolineales bacterium]|nr:hypothetical protein [Anaerolineales bacterium]
MSKQNELPKKNKKLQSDFEVVPPEFHHPGLGGGVGGVSFSPDGFSVLLIRALIEAKEAASKCAEDPDMQQEYQIFNRRALELEAELKKYLGAEAE